MPFSNQNFQCELAFDEKGACRIKVTCPQCGATRVGNAGEIKRWQTEHLCAKPDKNPDLASRCG